MNVLVISHTYCARINRDKWKVLSKQYKDVNLMVVFPKIWSDTLIKYDISEIEKENLENCKFLALDAFVTGNEVLYGYYPLKLIKILRDFKPGIIHVEQGDNAFSYFQTILLAKLFCRKARLIFFTWINWDVQHSLKYKILWKWIEKFNIKLSHGAITGNHAAKDILRNKKFLKPIKVLPQLGVDLSFFTPAKKPQDTVNVSFIGRITKEKGVFLLADAFNEVIKQSPKVNLFFVGTGSAEEDLKNYTANLESAKRIKFVSSIPHEKVKEILDFTDILVLPSFDTAEWKEQFGHILIEAMASKVVVIGSDAGEIPNVICDAGLIFKQKDLADLTNCLKPLIKHRSLRDDLAEKGYERVKELYSHEAIARETHSFWKEIKG